MSYMSQTGPPVGRGDVWYKFAGGEGSQFGNPTEGQN